jgi:hypothetical protein
VARKEVTESEQRREDILRQMLSTAVTDEWTSYRRARVQQMLAHDGLAEGQCPACGSYRLDGAPPGVHQPWCTA